MRREVLREWVRPFFQEERCGFCGSPLIANYGLCPHCAEMYHPLHQTRILYCRTGEVTVDTLTMYNDFFKKWYGDYKFHGKSFLRKGLSERLVDSIAECGIRMDWIAYVPMTAEKKCLRGYNPVEALARAAATAFDVPLLHVLQKKRNTKQQHLLSKQERQDNVQGAFTIRYAARGDFCGEYQGRRIVVSPSFFDRREGILFDDLMTSGQTMAEIAQLFLHQEWSFRGLAYAAASYLVEEI